MSRILVIEDNRDLGYGLRNNLEVEGHEVEVQRSGRTGLERVRAGRPDLVILDLMLPELDGFHVLQAMRDDRLEIPVLILSARGEESDKVRGLRLGAEDYLTKPFGVLELLARVEVLLRRGVRAGAAAADGDRQAVERFGDVVVDTARRVVTRAGRTVDLAPLEFDLLVALIRRRGAVVSRLDLLRDVWGYSDAALTRTVDTHVAELRRKLEAEPASPRHILTVRKVGYRHEP
jgi:DNA-binding response OmpR family regulator